MAEPNMFYGRTFEDIKALRWITFKPSTPQRMKQNVYGAHGVR